MEVMWLFRVLPIHLPFRCIVVVSGDDESCSTALIRFGSVCVAGYRVAECAIYGIL